MTLRFDTDVPRTGYAWWYVDAWSDDGRQGLALILFVGSVFSPYYARARQRSPAADPQDHCAVNLALYGARGERVPRAWCMTERGAARLGRSAGELRIGPSVAYWDGRALRIDVDELAVPRCVRLRGTIRVEPHGMHEAWHALDPAGRHRWRPIAPHCRVLVDFAQPAMRWQGVGYLDTNEGSRPLAEDFRRWDWMRAALPADSAAVAYDVTLRDGERRRLALRFDAGAARATEASPRHALPPSGWRLARFAASQAGASATVEQTLEDGPFYARSRVRTVLHGHEVVAMHESLSLDRWRLPVVQAMLPFRMPRRA